MLCLRIFSATVVLLCCSACATDYVTGKKTFILVSEGKEMAMGREADPSIVAQFGLYDNKPLAAFIDGIGQETAKVSHRPGLEYTFRVVDSPVVNAFALPGGWVYFTRGILAHFNSEDELAGVMGHEIGHVVARHGAEQMSKQQLAGIGLGLGTLVSKKVGEYGKLAQSGLNLIFLSYGRAQESESDRLGVEYSTKLGYDSHKMAAFFRTIGALSKKGGGSIPTFLSTHPDPGQREKTVHKLADEWRQKVTYSPRNTSRADYLKRIEGIVYGDDPRQGFVEKDIFYHPELRFQFPVPSGWAFQNSPAAVQMMDQSKKGSIQFSPTKGKTLSEAADAFVASPEISVISRTDRSINSLQALLVESMLTSQQSEKLKIMSCFYQKDGSIYVFHAFAAPADFETFRPTFRKVTEGFSPLTNQAALNKKPNRIRIRTATRDEAFAAALRRLGMAAASHEELALLNGVGLQENIKRGFLIKVIAP